MSADYGTQAPWFKAPILNGNADYSFHTVAGRPVLMFFMGSASFAPVARTLQRLGSYADVFDDRRACFFGVTTDPDDAASGKIAPRIPGIRYFLDYDRSISAAYGACSDRDPAYRPFLLVLDRRLRAVGRFELDALDTAMEALVKLGSEASHDEWAPVLSLPRVLEPELCRRLITLYEQQGGADSGFMRDVDGKTVTVLDHQFKRRSDYRIEDARLRAALAARINQRIRPAVQLAFQFEARRVERYIVACYDAALRGHFNPHRDNTTKGTAHRKFAVTINLNSEEYEGGNLRFPEFGDRTYRAPTGGAIVFSCGLLHEATPVTSGRRYAFLPFLYDDAAAALREQNNAFLGDGVGAYSSS
jgi:predicted 2-oxoglutarate/Fe(II)-dependent dioxygenase YbiX